MAEDPNKIMTQKTYASKKLWRLVMALFISVLAVASSAWAQSSGSPAIRLNVHEDGVYIYHTLQLSTGQGFNIYRSDDGGAFEQLNERPIQGAQNVAEFLGQIGPYAQVLQEALELESPTAVYLRLRSSRLAANLTTFYYPDVARALGHLFVDTTAPVGEKVTYRIELTNDRGEPTGKQLEKEAVLQKITAPQPTNLKAEYSRRQLTLSWDYPTSTMETDDKIVRFNVYNQQEGKLKKINKAPIVRINNFEEFTHTLSVPRTGITFNLVVMPVDLAMEEGPASEVFTYTVEDEMPPAIVTGLQAVATKNGKIELTWPVSMETDAAGYNLFRAERIKGTYEKLNDDLIPLLETFYVDQPKALKKTYFYRISAVDSSGNESERSNASKADLPDYAPPSAPTSFNAEMMENGEVKLSWESGKVEEDFKSYILLRKRQGRFIGKADAQLNDDDLTANTFIDEGEGGQSLTEGAKYQYQIFAMDSARNFSDTLTAIIKIPDNTPPEAPTSLIVENDDGIRAVLRWNASRSTDVGNYVVYRGTDESTMTSYKTVSVKERSMRDDSVAKAETYFYAVSAVDTLGNEGEKMEAESFFMRDFTPPRAVRNVRASKQNGEVTITWEPVNSSDLAGYRVYTSQSPTGVYSTITDNLINKTEFKTDNLDTDLWIQVRAFDTSENESKPSKPAFIYVPENSSN